MFWLAMIPMSFAMGWLNSVVYASALSLRALVSRRWSAWQAARVEVDQRKELEREKQEPVEDKVADRIVEETDLERT